MLLRVQLFFEGSKILPSFLYSRETLFTNIGYDRVVDYCGIAVLSW